MAYGASGTCRQHLFKGHWSPEVHTLSEELEGTVIRFPCAGRGLWAFIWACRLGPGVGARRGSATGDGGSLYVAKIFLIMVKRRSSNFLSGIDTGFAITAATCNKQIFHYTQNFKFMLRNYYRIYFGFRYLFPENKHFKMFLLVLGRNVVL